MKYFFKSEIVRKIALYAVPAFVALFARIYFAFYWLNSPFRYYHTVNGLDMKTLLQWGVEFRSGSLPFSVYKFLIAALYAVAGEKYLTESVAFIQMGMGIAVAVMTVFVYRFFFGGRFGAMTAGILCGIYAPLIVYETHILKETLFLFLAFSSFTLLLYMIRKRFSTAVSISAGAVAVLPFFVRFSGLLWLFSFYALTLFFILRKKYSLKKILPVTAGTILIIFSVFMFNYSRQTGIKRYFSPNSSYLLKVGAAPGISTLSPDKKAIRKLQKKTTVIPFIINYTSKVIYIFTPYEIPNNINYYYEGIKTKTMPFILLSFFLIPLSLAGMILMAITFRKNRRVILFTPYMLSFIIPMILFVPLARYKIALTPVYAFFAAWWISEVYKKIRMGKREQLVIPLLLFFASLFFSAYLCRNLPYRSCDDQAYGIAASYIPNKLMMQGNFADAEKILSAYYADSPSNPLIILNYSSSLLGTGQLNKAEKILYSVRMMPTPALTGRFYYELAECSFMLRKVPAAFKYYKLAIKYPISERRKELALERINYILRLNNSKNKH